MKQKYVFVIFALLIIGAVNVPSIIAQAPVNGLATGDHFAFDGHGSENQQEYRNAEMYNTSDGSLIHYDENGMVRDVSSTENSDVFVIKNRPTLPPLDTVLVIKSNGTSDAGSYETNSFNSTFYNQTTGNMEWDNSTDTRDLSNMPINDNGNDQPNYMKSNSTYALIFPEMEMSTFNIPMDGGLPFNTTFDGQINLSSRTISSGSGSYMINGATQSITYTNVSQTFSRHFTEDLQVYIPFGDQNDPNTPWIQVNATVTIDVSYSTYYAFDTGNKMVVEVGEKTNFMFGVNMTGYNVMVDFDPYNPGGETTLNFFSDMSVNASRSHVSVMSHANSFYGNTRPVSSGSSALETGDVLKYDFEQYSEGGMNAFVSAGARTESNMVQATRSTEGELTIDVFRHSNNFMESVLYIDGTSSGSFKESMNVSDPVDGPDSSSDFQSYGPVPAMHFDHLEGPSTSTMEIAPFFSPSMHFEDFFQCQGPDCGNDFYPQFPHEAPRTSSTVNVTDWTVDLPAMGEDPLVINGHNFYYFNVTIHQVDYAFSATQNIDIPIGDKGSEIWVTANMDIQFEGRSAWYYDKATGALLAHDESFDGNVDIYGQWTVPGPNGQSMDVQVDANLYSYHDMSMFLKAHPNYYDVGQTKKVDTQNNDTITNSSSEQPGSSQDTPALPVPVPFAPVIFSVSLMALFINRRRR